MIRITKFVRCLVIGSVYCLLILTGGFIYLLYAAGKRSLSQTCSSYGPVSPNYCDSSTYIFYLVLSLIVAFFLVIYLYRIMKRISSFEIGIILIEITSKPLWVMKELTLFPLLQIIIGSGILLLLLILICFNMSSYSPRKINSIYIPGNSAYILEYSALEKYILVYNAIMSL